MLPPHFRLRTDLSRAELGPFRFALGLVPVGDEPPHEGYTVEYVSAEDDEGPDSYVFYVTASHERLAALMRDLFQLLTGEIFPIVEIGSRDAYRAIDVWMAQDPVSLETFLEGWTVFEPFFLEDGSVSAGANCEEPPVEIFLDHWKGITIHVPLLEHEEVERILDRHGLGEVAETWADDDRDEPIVESRAILDLSSPELLDVEDILLDLQSIWQLELNIDPHVNLDDAGRDLGMTLWFAMVIMADRADPQLGCYASVWATASNLADVQDAIAEELGGDDRYEMEAFYTLDRVAYDERPDELASLPPRREKTEVHLVTYEPWTGDGPGGEADARRRTEPAGDE